MTGASAARAPLTGEGFARILAALGRQGEEDVAWSEGLGLPANADDFAMEAIWVLCNSGMKHTVARIIQGRVLDAIRSGRPVREAFAHPGKASAMQHFWDRREEQFEGFLEAEDRLSYLAGLPWIGKITKYHLAKNCGIDCAKPDVHLDRLARLEGADAHAMCARLAGETGYRIATVDVVLWRSCATGVLDSRTGRVAA